MAIWCEQIAGGDVAALMDQIAAAAQANFRATVLSSRYLGRQSDEIMGNQSFTLDMSIDEPVVPG